MENNIKGKLEVEIAGRKIEVRVIETPSNQYGYVMQRVYSKFIDRVHPQTPSNNKKSNEMDKIMKLKEKIEKMPDEDIY